MTYIIGQSPLPTDGENKVYNPGHTKGQLLYEGKHREAEHLYSAIQTIKKRNPRYVIGYTNGKFR